MPMQTEPTSNTHSDQASLDQLAAELTTRGFQTTRRTSLDGFPCLTVRNPRASVLAEIVYVRGNSYHWSWHEPIAPTSQPTTAAGILARVLRAIDD
jgi:hypothetical protein